MASSFWLGAQRRDFGLDWGHAAVFAVLAFASCCAGGGLSSEAQAQAPAATYSPHMETESSSVRAFMQTVAHDVTHDGPTAWLKFFDDSPAFFMAVNGAMAFPSSSVAREGTLKFAGTIQSIELKWGDDLRVDPLGTGLAVVGATWHEVQIDKAGRRVEEGGYFTGVVERKQGQWRFRDAHWSSPVETPVAQ
jgi:hypothetical protein